MKKISTASESRYGVVPVFDLINNFVLVVDHGQFGCEDVISEIWSSSSPVVRDFVQCGRDHAGKVCFS